jgi:CubicO group peptidase (beta-lactamase class C family)
MKKKLVKSGKTIGVVFLIIVLLATGVSVLAPKPPPPPKTASSMADLETYLNKLVEYGDPPGLSLVVVKNGNPVYTRAFGLADGPNQIPATPDTVYHWWSTTKMFTAVAIFQLQEEGLLNIDDPVIKYLPVFDVKYPSSSSQPITIRHLLNHSSGIPDNMLAVIGWMHLENQPRLDQTALLEKVLPDYSKLNFEPGTQAVYTNVGYMVLGAIIEKVSGQTYEDYIVEHVLQPLEMKHTNFVYTNDMLPDAAVGMHPVISFQSIFLPFAYGNRLSGFIREIKGGRMWFNRFYADSDPPTGLIGSATDLSRFVAANLNGGELDGQRILSQSSVDTMMHEGYISSSGPQTDWPTQGLGWEICGEGEHGGGGPGFGSAIRLLPNESLGIILTANSTNIDREAILALVASLAWK